MSSTSRNGRTLRLLHTSDLHLGSGDGCGFGEHGGSAQQLRPLERVVGVAIDEGVDIVVVTGDLLDSNRLGERIVRDVAEVLSELPMPIILLPGNHDCYTPDSAYRRFPWANAVPRLHLITREEGETISFPALDLAIWGRPHTSYADCSPLDPFPPRGPERWQVALAHGHVVKSKFDMRYRYLIQPQDIAATRRDYVALGHWEIMADVSDSDVLAAYSGSPQRTGAVLLVELGETVRYRRKEI